MSKASSTSRTISLPQVGGAGSPSAPRSRMGRRRAAVLILVHVAIAAHIAHWKIAGETISPVEPSESMQTLEQGIVNAGFIFFAAAILLTLIFGRFVCGWACHIVALQDLCGWMMKKIGIRPVAFRSRLLVWAPLGLALYMFVWPTVRRIWLTGELHPRPDGFVSGVTTTEFWETFPGIAIAIPFLLICGFATVYFLGAKGFCTYGCPYGGVFYPVDRLSPGRIIMDPNRCDGNGHCTAVCTSNVRVHEEIKQFGMVVDPGCMKCMDCVSACPTDALSFGFAKPSIAVKRAAKRAAKSAARKSSKTKRPRRAYDLSWPEEIALAAIFLTTFFATRGLYGVVPLLMAVGLAGCCTFILWKGWRVVRTPNVRLHKLQLRFKGKLRPVGAAYVAGSTVLAVLILQSLTINIITQSARNTLNAVQLDKQALLKLGHAPLDETDIAIIERALTRYELVAPIWRGGFGLANNPSADNTMAILYLALDRYDEAHAALERVVSAIAPKAKMRGEALMDIAALQMLRARTNQDRALADQAIATLARATRVLPHDPAVFETYAAALFQTGNDLDGAIVNMRIALDLDPFHVERWMHIAPLLLMKGDIDGAIEALDHALDQAPLEQRDALIQRGRALLRQMGHADRAAQWGPRE